MEPFRTSLLTQILIIFLLILLNAIFSAAEMAFVAVDRQEIEHLAETGNSQAQRVLSLLEQPDRFLTTVEVVLTVSGFLVSAMAAWIFTPWLVAHFPQLASAFPLLFLLVIFLTAFVVLVLGELFPKQVALQMPERIALRTSGIIQAVGWLISPFAYLLLLATKGLKKLTPLEFTQTEGKFTRSEMKALLTNSRRDGAIDKEELVMLQGVLSLDSKIAREVMTPRTDAQMIDIDEDPQTNLEVLLESPYSRIPIYREEKDNVIGVILIKNLLRHIAKEGTEDLDLLALAQEPMSVPATIFIDDLLVEFREQQQHLAILKDEYGGMEGIVTLEDLIEEIVGEIEDETDVVIQEEITQIDEDSYLISGGLGLDKFNQVFQTNLQSEDVDTIAGYIIQRIGYMPEDDERISLRIAPWVVTTSQVEGGRIRGLQLIHDQDQHIDVQYESQRTGLGHALDPKELSKNE